MTDFWRLSESDQILVDKQVFYIMDLYVFRYAEGESFLGKKPDQLPFFGPAEYTSCHAHVIAVTALVIYLKLRPNTAPYFSPVKLLAFSSVFW